MSRQRDKRDAQTTANDTNDTDNTDDTAIATMNAAQITELLAMLACGADRTPLPHMPGAPSFDRTNVTAFLEKYESLAQSTASAVIGHFPYYCTEDVRETVLMLPAYAYCDDVSRSRLALRAEMLDTFRALDSAAFKLTRRNLERLCSAFCDHSGDCPVCPRNLELKSFLLAYHRISERVAASGMM